MENERPPLPTGWDYSALLIKRTRSTLIERYGEPITDEIVARHLEVETERVRAVMDGKSTFGKEYFRRQAESYDQTLLKFISDLIRWHRKTIGTDNGDLSEDTSE